MKKSIIWLLTIVMSITFGALLYFQIMYLENMVKMREEQFSENVMRSLYATASYLEKREALHFLEKDVNIIESTFYDTYWENEDPFSFERSINEANSSDRLLRADQPQPLSTRYRNMQEIIRSQYLYQKGLLNEVILSILQESSTRPILERADSAIIRQYLSAELINNGLSVPYVFAIEDTKGALLYATDGFNSKVQKGKYTVALFSHTANPYQLQIEFPTKNNYIFSSVRFIIPTLALTLILLIIFLYTILLAFRQKKLSEMKTDFINNMTHELKTPISTISLAGQMLSDDSVRKSPTTLKHLSQVITDESKRLRFQVEKVLQMSVFDNQSSALKFTVLDANTVIQSVVHTFKIKVEKFGGTITTNLDARNAMVRVDEMHFTNVIFNLLDNAVKYMREETAPMLVISTSDTDNSKLEIRIRDNGIGIKKDDLKRIFDKFYRVSTGNRHDVKGFGLGLAYVKKMVVLFKGTIQVESELGKGSTFIIHLPLYKSDFDSTDNT